MLDVIISLKRRFSSDEVRLIEVHFVTRCCCLHKPPLFYIKSYCETVDDECSHMIIDHELYGIAVDALHSSDFLLSCNTYNVTSFSFIDDDFIRNMLKRSESFFWSTRFLSSFCGIEKTVPMRFEATLQMKSHQNGNEKPRSAKNARNFQLKLITLKLNNFKWYFNCFYLCDYLVFISLFVILAWKSSTKWSLNAFSSLQIGFHTHFQLSSANIVIHCVVISH